MDNLRGAAWMTLAMLGFALADTFIKLLSDDFPIWQIIAILGFGGALTFGAATLAQGQSLFPRAVLSKAVIIRNIGEVLGTLGFVTALTLIPLSSASAILQATPLVVTLGAALFLAEKVGWKRWSAILVGFFGVMLIIRPGMDGFNVHALFAVLAVIGLAIRDLATRWVPRNVSSSQLSFFALLVLIPAAFLLGAITAAPMVRPQGWDWAVICGAVSMGVLAYFSIVTAMRVGEISFVTPFRYSRILFALVIGVVIFGERPDALMLIGAALIVGSGLFTLWRERKHRAAT
ncbi:DMT family transporter [bacterium]|nr:DMT family transporter [bacterium]